MWTYIHAHILLEGGKLGKNPAPTRQDGSGVQWVCEGSRRNSHLILISHSPQSEQKKTSGLLVLLCEGLWWFKEDAGVEEML